MGASVCAEGVLGLRRGGHRWREREARSLRCRYRLLPGGLEARRQGWAFRPRTPDESGGGAMPFVDEPIQVGGPPGREPLTDLGNARRRVALEAQAVRRWALASESLGRMEAMAALARSQPEIAAEPRVFDADPWLLACANGAVDLRTGALRPDRRGDLNTRTTGIAYDPGATAPCWETWLDRVVGGIDDLLRRLQRAVGMSVAGAGWRPMAVIWLGDGRDAILATVIAALGEHATWAPVGWPGSAWPQNAAEAADDARWARDERGCAPQAVVAARPAAGGAVAGGGRRGARPGHRRWRAGVGSVPARGWPWAWGAVPRAAGGAAGRPRMDGAGVPGVAAFRRRVAR